MKKYITTIGALMVFLFVGSVFGQVFSPDCPTLEQQAAAYNRKQAAAIVVKDKASQQLQCHHRQLATHYDQLHTSKVQAAKDVQQKLKDQQQAKGAAQAMDAKQKAKDLQQQQKDVQQMQKDAQQSEMDGIIAEKMAALNTAKGKYDELKTFIEVILPYVGDCSEQLKKELVRIHTNRSGHADGTNPGGQTKNINGFDNPGFIIAK